MTLVIHVDVASRGNKVSESRERIDSKGSQRVQRSENPWKSDGIHEHRVFQVDWPIEAVPRRTAGGKTDGCEAIRRESARNRRVVLRRRRCFTNRIVYFVHMRVKVQYKTRFVSGTCSGRTTVNSKFWRTRSSLSASSRYCRSKKSRRSACDRSST